MDSFDAPSRIDKGPASSYGHPNWSNHHYHQSDVADGRDVHRDTDVRGGRERGYNGPRMANKGGQGRRQRGYKQLFQKVMRGERDTLDTDGRMPSEMSVEELVKVCCSLPASASAVTAVAPSLAYLDSRATAALMKELAKCQQLSRAMEIFDWLKSLPAVHELYSLCDVYTFTTAISLMGPSQQLRRALEYIGEMRARGLQCNVHTYSALMNVCIKCDACDLALDVFKQMHEDKIRPNVVTYNTLVDVYGKTGQWEKAVQVLDDMRLEDLEPEVRTFNTAIIACNMCGQPQEALKVYQKLLETGLQPISTTYTALISAYGKAGQLEQALDTFQTMIQQGCERSVITYSALISACEKAGRWELALQLFDQMKKEGCAPNTVTYNSLITACQQGGQPEKACEVFEQMKYHGCRPDVVTYTALINAHNKAGQWRKALQAFEQMQQQNCKPDSFVYQTVIDSLWQTGVSWAHNRAWQLYASAARNWQYRFTVQLANNNNSRELEYVVPAFSPGVAVLALRKWLADLVTQVESDSTLLGLSRERIVLSLGRGRQAKEPANNCACQAITAVLKGFRSPFRSGDGSITSAGNVVIAEASMPAALEWLCNPELPEFLTLLVPPNTANSRQPSPLGGAHKRISFAADLAEDSKLDDSCQRAYNTVVDFEMAQLLLPASMSSDYLAEREGCISAAFKLADQFDLAEEVVFDAVLLMDRVMSTGAQHDSSLSLLFVAAALRIAALQTVASSDQAAIDSLPSDALLATATGFPEGSVTKMEQNITTALSGDTKSISMLRSLKLFLERMGAEQQDVPAAQHLCKGTVRLLRSALLDPALLSSRPSVVAAAVLVSARQAVGCHPFFPACLEQLTGMRGGTENCPELATAAAAIEPLIPAAALEPPPRITPQMLAAANRPVSSGRMFNHLAPGLNGAGSGYSTPSHASTPTAAGVGNVPFIPNKTLLDAVVRQHSMQRAASDISSLSTRSEGSAADLQALLSSTAAAAAVAAGNMAASPVPPGLGSSALMPPPEPALAAAMAGLQLGMNVNMNIPGMQGVPGLAGIGPGFMPQIPGYNPWLAAGAFNIGAPAADPYQLAAMQHQQQQASRLAQMTNPYTMPMAQHAMMLNNANLLQ